MRNWENKMYRFKLKRWVNLRKDRWSMDLKEKPRGMNTEKSEFRIFDDLTLIYNTFSSSFFKKYISPDFDFRESTKSPQTFA